MTRLPAPLRQLCSSVALAGRDERWDASCDGRVELQAALLRSQC